MPKPRLLSQQFYATLQHEGVEVVACEGEADQDLAKVSADDRTGRTFVLSKDTDFLLFAGCRFIEFNTLMVSWKG